MYWSDWSYGKNRMNSKLENHFYHLKKSLILNIFFVFVAKNNDYPIESVVYETKLPSK